MTLILIFLGCFILSSLWGFLPVVEPVRLFAQTSSLRRKMTALAGGLLALLTGILLLLWLGSYSTAVIMAYDAHASSASQDPTVQAPAVADVFSVTNELVLRQLLPGAGCLNGDAEVCAMAAQALQLGGLTRMLPIISAAALLPALMAAFICWKLTAVSQAADRS